MIASESSRARRFVGRLDRGTDLLTQLAELCRTHAVRAGEVRVVGTVQGVTLGQRRLDGVFELVTFAGMLVTRAGALAVQAAATLAREDGTLLGGRLATARVVACDFVVDAFDGVALDAQPGSDGPAARTPVAAAHAPVPPVAAAHAAPPPVAAASSAAPPVAAASPAAPPVAVAPVAAPPVAAEPAADKPAVMFDPPARTSWSDVMRASEHRSAAPVAAEVDDEPLPSSSEPVNVRPGDFIDHPKFGRVAVERVDSDQEFVTARLRNQRLIRLSLDVLTLIPAGQADGKNLFRAVAGK